MRLLWILFLRLQGWTLKGSYPYHLKKSVLIVGPHTSSWDFVIGLAFRSKLRLYDAKFLGKAELFKGPFGFFFRRLGGFPVERSSSHQMVEQVVSLFNTHETFHLALSPEGTRKKVDRLKTGFYHIAREANVPVVMVGFDFANRLCIIAEPFLPSDEEKDFQHIIAFYQPIQGKIPEQGLMDLSYSAHQKAHTDAVPRHA
jgi:1-acyl-sn-glycerol-3-phosphate acyltransferase